MDSLLDVGDPPVVLVHGTADDVVPFSLSEAIVARADSVGVPNSFMPIDGLGHVNVLEDPVLGPQVFNFVNAFFYDELDLAAVPEPNGIGMVTIALVPAAVASTRRRGRRS